MSLSVTLVTRANHLVGGVLMRVVDLLFDSSYATGGEVVDASSVGFGSIIAGIDTQSGTADGPYKFKYNGSTGKMQAYRSGGAPIEVYTQGDIKGSAITDFVGAGGYTTLPTNGALLSALAAADNTTAFTISVSPDIARVLALIVKDTTGGSVSGNAADYVIVGTFRGAAQTETISFSAANLATMANGNVAVKYGVKPFDTVTSVTPSAAQPTGFEHALGIGSKLGLPTATATNAEADILKLFKNGANLSPSGLYSTNQTINFGTLADGDDISAEYLGSSGFAEVASGFDLSAVTARILFLGQ